MEDVEGIIIREMRELIKDSCKADPFPERDHIRFHKAFLKFYFGALEVELDYEKQTISIWNSKPLNETSLALRDFVEGLMESVSYTNLEETLQGCVEEGIFNKRFYKHLLCEFDRFPNVNGTKSA